MTRPLAVFRDGLLWLDRGYTDYTPSNRFQVVMKRAVMEELSGPDAARAVEECTKALEAYDEHEREKA